MLFFRRILILGQINSPMTHEIEIIFVVQIKEEYTMYFVYHPSVMKKIFSLIFRHFWFHYGKHPAHIDHDSN